MSSSSAGGSAGPTAWPTHVLRVGSTRLHTDSEPDPAERRPEVEPWLSAVLQSEHLSLLVGNGLPTAVAGIAGISSSSMAAVDFGLPEADRVNAYAESSADAMGRGAPNIEDQLRAALQLTGGLEVLNASNVGSWRGEIARVLRDLANTVLQTERNLWSSLGVEDDQALDAARCLVSFLLTFASRAASRERLHLFGLNYDRLLELGCDLAGVRSLDRFVGALSPVFRASRLDVDLHYNPPGIRGEPRYLEGVIRLTKLHGSLDWRADAQVLRRIALPFGAAEDHPGLPDDPYASLMIYPNPAKDRETLDYPYAELFRDFSAALCRPNCALVTYGYGFGDDHINRVIRDMLSIPSTHLVAISYDDEGGRLQAFTEQSGREAQVSLLIGPHFGDLKTLIEHYLPKPALDRVTLRMSDLLRAREVPSGSH